MSTQELQTMLESFEDAAIQPIEDSETFGTEGNKELQDVALRSAQTYATLAVMLQNKLSRGVR